MIDKEKSVIVFCFRDNVLRDVAVEAITTLMWAKLE